MLDTDLDSAAVSLELLDGGQAHDCVAHIAQALGREVGAGDVFDVGAEVDARVLLGVAVGSYINISDTVRVEGKGQSINLRNEWFTPAE